MSIDDDDAPPSIPATAALPTRRAFSTEREAVNKPYTSEKDAKGENTTPDPAPSIQASQPSRRLSVQDRINMFENKQKENSGGKPAELRRLSSDVSEKAVIRRWSGASDMSISLDLSSDKKDADSPVHNTASAAASLGGKGKVLNSKDDNAEVLSAANLEMNAPNLKGAAFANSHQLTESNKNDSNLGSGESEISKHQERGKTQSLSFIGRTEVKESSEDDSRTPDSVRKEGVIEFSNQMKSSDGEFSGSKTQMTGFKDQVSSSSSQIKCVQSKSGQQPEISEQSESYESRDEPVKEIRLQSAQKAVVDSGAGSRIRQAFASRYKGIEGESSSVQKEVRSVKGTEVVEKNESGAFVARAEVTPLLKTEVGRKKESPMSEKVLDNHVLNVEDSGPQKPKFGRQVLTADLSKRARVQRDDASSSGNSRSQFSGQVTVDSQGSSDSFSTPTSQPQRVRQPKGNQELDDLKVKASELEKMFAEHKLRVPGDQFNSSRKGRSEETPCEPELSSSLQYTKQMADVTSQSSRLSKNSTKFDSASPMKAVDSHYESDAVNTKFSDLNISESSRGKLYDRYMQKRDAKLREEWSANREEKEARLKSLQDSIERNKSEMKAKNFGQDSVLSAHRRAERVKSYNSRSIMKREQVDS